MGNSCGEASDRVGASRAGIVGGIRPERDHDDAVCSQNGGCPVAEEKCSRFDASCRVVVLVLMTIDGVVMHSPQSAAKVHRQRDGEVAVMHMIFCAVSEKDAGCDEDAEVILRQVGYPLD